MKKPLLTLFTLLLFANVFAQDEQRSYKVDFALEGMAGVAFGKNFTSFNVVGPSLLLHVNQKVKIGLSLFHFITLTPPKNGFGLLGLVISFIENRKVLVFRCLLKSPYVWCFENPTRRSHQNILL